MRLGIRMYEGKHDRIEPFSADSASVGCVESIAVRAFRGGKAKCAQNISKLAAKSDRWKAFPGTPVSISDVHCDPGRILTRIEKRPDQGSEPAKTKLGGKRLQAFGGNRTVVRGVRADRDGDQVE